MHRKMHTFRGVRPRYLDHLQGDVLPLGRRCTPGRTHEYEWQERPGTSPQARCGRPGRAAEARPVARGNGEGPSRRVRPAQGLRAPQPWTWPKTNAARRGSDARGTQIPLRSVHRCMYRVNDRGHAVVSISNLTACLCVSLFPSRLKLPTFLHLLYSKGSVHLSSAMRDWRDRARLAHQGCLRRWQMVTLTSCILDRRYSRLRRIGRVYIWISSQQHQKEMLA